MNKMKRIIPILTGLNLLLTVAVTVFLFITYTTSEKPFPQGEKEVNYTLYIGLNDKDTYTQEIPTDVAREIVDKICLKHVEGFTVSAAQGGWTDENGTVTYENTLVYMFSDTDEDKITAIMDEAITALNQSSILVLTDNVYKAFYSGAEVTE